MRVSSTHNNRHQPMEEPRVNQIHQRRRAIIALGAGALWLPRISLAQQPGKTVRIGSAYIANAASTRPYEDAFLDAPL